MHPYSHTLMPLDLAKRMIENRGGEAVEQHDRLEIRRNGQYLGAPLIVDGCVNFITVCGIFAAHPRS